MLSIIICIVILIMIDIFTTLWKLLYHSNYRKAMKQVNDYMIDNMPPKLELIVMEEKLKFVHQILEYLDKKSEAYSKCWDERNQLILAINTKKAIYH